MSDGYFNPCLMLSLLYHKHNALIATAADGEEDTFPQVLQWQNYNLHQNTISIWVKSFLHYFVSKMILLNI